MVIDSSAMISILLQEPDASAMAKAILGDAVRMLSAMTALETAVVIEGRRGPSGGGDFDRLLHRAKIEVVPFTAEHFAIARDAYLRYGKGFHPAGLNHADCCSYALAKFSGEPLLAKGSDFSKTDIALCS
jgi:ribonuclease VapC